jgi:anti-sigma factor RsiW
MSCGHEEDLTAYVDGELSALRERQVALHLTTCADCHATESLLRRTVAHLTTLPAFELSADVRRAVLHRIDQSPGLLERWRSLLGSGLLMPSMGMAAAALAVVVLSSLQQHPASEALDVGQVELAANLDVVADLDVVGLTSPEDLEVIQHLQELEAQP